MWIVHHVTLTHGEHAGWVVLLGWDWLWPWHKVLVGGLLPLLHVVLVSTFFWLLHGIILLIWCRLSSRHCDGCARFVCDLVGDFALCDIGHLVHCTMICLGLIITGCCCIWHCTCHYVTMIICTLGRGDIRGGTKLRPVHCTCHCVTMIICTFITRWAAHFTFLRFC